MKKAKACLGLYSKLMAERREITILARSLPPIKTIQSICLISV